MRKSQFEMKDSAAVGAGDLVWVYGQWLKVRQVRRLTQHPFQFVQIWFHEFSAIIVVPLGWQIRCARTDIKDVAARARV